MCDEEELARRIVVTIDDMVEHEGLDPFLIITLLMKKLYAYVDLDFVIEVCQLIKNPVVTDEERERPN